MFDVEKQQARQPQSPAHIVGDNWMASIEDTVPICEISIPGTHDSAAYTRHIPFIQTQDADIVSQLDRGVRYLDLRCGLDNDVLQMVHGSYLLGLSLRTVLQDVYAWLDRHPSEGLLVQIKKDRKDKASSHAFIEAISTLIHEDVHRWRLARTTPNMADLRGKIQLLRRFKMDKSIVYGIDVSGWQDNPQTPFTMEIGAGVRVTVQDHYLYRDPLNLHDVIRRKYDEVSQLLLVAENSDSNDQWYINYTSAVELNWTHHYSPRAIALGSWSDWRPVPGIHVKLSDRLGDLTSPTRLGIVVLDFADDSKHRLPAAIYRANFGRDRVQSSLVRQYILLTFCSLMIVTLYMSRDRYSDSYQS